MIHRHLNWQNSVQIVAVPLHAVVINIVGVLYGDKLLIHQFCDVLHHCGHGKMHGIRDGAVTGMALMGSAVFAVEQVGVDCDRSVTDVQEKQLIG